MSDYCMEGYQRFAVAVVERAVVDYTRALRRLSRHPNDADAKRGKVYSDLDGESIIRAIREKVDQEMRH